jgi:hypothetical protein
MPNWCANRLTVIVPLVNGKNPLIEFLPEGELTFDRIAPCPKLVKYTSEQSQRDKKTGLIRREFVYSPDGEDKPGARRLNSEQVQMLMTIYGCVGWYSWNCENWGTKWDINPTQPSDISGPEVEFHFETAWSPPETVARTLSGMFGGCEVTLDFFEAGCDFGGRAVYRNGDCVEDQHLTARASRDISDWHEAMYGPDDNEEEENDNG